MQLPPPPFWEAHLIDHPLPLMVGLAIIAVFLFLLGQRLQSWRLLVAAITVLALISGVFVTGKVVVTPRRQLIDRTKDWVACTAPTIEVNKACSFCNRTCTVVGTKGEFWLDINGLANKLVDLSRTRLIQEQDIVSVQAVANDDKQGQSLLHLRTAVGDPASPLWVPSTWLITWTNLSGEWYATEIRCMAINDQPVPSLDSIGLLGTH